MATFYDYRKNILSVGGGGGGSTIESAPSAQVLDADDICEGVAVYKNGTIKTSSSFGATSYISCRGAKKMTIARIVTTSSTDASNYGIAFYNDSLNAISFVESVKGAENGMQIAEVDIPTDAVWFKASYWNFQNSLKYGNFYAVVESADIADGNRPYQSDLIFFAPKVNQSVNEFWVNDDDTVSMGESYKATTGVLLLPSTYTPNGKKTPLILYCHGFSHMVSYGKWGSTDTFLEQKHHWADMGFAVMDCNGAYHTTTASGANNFGTSPQNCEAYYKAVKWVQENYNVEDTIYIVGGSMGGQPCMQMLATHRELIRACALLEPHCNAHHWMIGDSGKMSSRFKVLFGITDEEYTDAPTNVIDDYKDKFIGYIPEWRYETIGDKEYLFNYPPTKLWYGTYSNAWDGKRVVNAIRNAGGEASMRHIGLNHSSIVSGANEIVDTDIANFFKRY